MGGEESAEVIVPCAVVREGPNSMIRKESMVVRPSYIAEILAEVGSHAEGYWAEPRRIRTAQRLAMDCR